jgi:geranylgeranyl pyrophosphate synthase
MSDVMLEYQNRIQAFLNASLNNLDVPERLRAAMRYSTLSGGKRFRALLVYASGLAVGAPLARLDTVAAALECMQAYSLIHDDLPAMDDDNLRRGLPTNHIQYDEATAILAGDALQALAFEMIANESSGLSDAQARSICLELATSSGQTGMVGGQILDIQATNCQLSREALENIHRRKTGALINAAVICGALCSDHTTTRQLNDLSNYANNLGLAFQVVDDILDIESSTQELGKPSGSDVENGKSTYPALIGLQESKKLAQTLYQESIVSIAAIGDNTSLLEDLAKLVVERTK